MKKTLVILLISAVFVQIASAQKFGAKGGLNISSISTDQTLGTYSTKTGLNASIFYQKNLFPMLSIRPEIGYSQLGYNYTLLNTETTQYLNYLQFSVDLRLSPPILPLYVVAGPYASYALSGSYKMGSTSFDTEFGKDKTLAYDYGINAGIGYVQNLAILKLFVEFRYEMGMLDFYGYSNNEYKKNHNISITLGFML